MHYIRLGPSYVNLDYVIAIDADPETSGGALVETVSGRVRKVAPGDAGRLRGLADRLIDEARSPGRGRAPTTKRRKVSDDAS